LRYVFGPASAAAPLAPKTATPTGLEDLFPVIAGRDDSGLTLDFPAYDPAKTQPPAEARAYWILEGMPEKTADELVASATPCSTASLAIGPEGHAGLKLPTPDAAYPAPGTPAVSYLVKTVLGFNV
jgi:hypothetical protein